MPAPYGKNSSGVVWRRPDVRPIVVIITTSAPRQCAPTLPPVTRWATRCALDTILKVRRSQRSENRAHTIRPPLTRRSRAGGGGPASSGAGDGSGGGG